MLTISIQDMDRPGRGRKIEVTCSDLFAALYELEYVAGPSFRKELMGLGWQLLTPDQPTPGAGQPLPVKP